MIYDMSPSLTYICQVFLLLPLAMVRRHLLIVMKYHQEGIIWEYVDSRLVTDSMYKTHLDLVLQLTRSASSLVSRPVPPSPVHD